MHEHLPKKLESGPMTMAIWLVVALAVAFGLALLFSDLN